MSTATDLEFDDGTPVRFLLTPGDGAAAPVASAAAVAPDDDLPEGMGRAIPVAAGGRAVANFAAGALRGALKPLGPLLQEVHDAVTAAAEPPTEVSVTFGVQVGQDLKFGIVGGKGQAHLTVTACWKPTAAADADATSVAE
ncbi:CU044_2847 family protein [Streptomyces sp. ISL-96]|uniref:CU044_2847 family protein n=1 Tax=Streptomyces sp. ISL-96 TaxID=2819191 RepID=UPI0027E278EE|nr:CU044_2847 family protein [Streptomyces sp. ISL-96]